MQDKEALLEEFIQKHILDKPSDKAIITLEDLKTSEIVTENLLEHLVKKHNFLLYSSKTRLPGYIRAYVSYKYGQHKEILSTSRAAEAIIKALIDEEKLIKHDLRHPIYPNIQFSARIKGLSHAPLAEKGNIYLIEKTREFKNEPKGTTQYRLENKIITYRGLIETTIHDFLYPIFDSDKKEWIK